MDQFKSNQTHQLNDRDLLLEADRCVKCGLCLPHCPTYRITRDECESPRGRIALIQGLLDADLPPDDSLQRHLDHCLHCLNCQHSCPSGVDYGNIIDGALSRLPGRSHIIAGLMVKISISPWGQHLVRLFRNSLLYPLSLNLAPRWLKNLLKLLPPLSVESPPADFTTSPAAANQLFLGCVSRLTDQRVINAFRKITNRLQIPLATPSDQDCCGAMHAHGGDRDKAEYFQHRNTQAFNEAKTIISLASGCGAYLKQYLGDRVVDAAAFLAETDWPDGLTLKPFNGVIAVHTPCSLRNSMQSDKQVVQLIEKIPNVKYQPLSLGNGCCGAAGLQLITQPEMGQALLTPTLKEIINLQPKVVITSNTGCALHIRRGLQDSNIDIPVLHPVELIATLLP